MKVLVLGASSAIGNSIAARFAPGNRLLLTGRNETRLNDAAVRCRAAGGEADVLRADLAADADATLDAAVDFAPDVIVNAVCATSRLRDGAITPGDLPVHVTVDLVEPVRIVSALLGAARGRDVGVVFVSTILAVVHSPRRAVYGGLKAVHEQCLRTLVEAHPGARLLIVRVATPVDRRGSSRRGEALGAAVRKAFDDRRATLTYGAAGRVLWAMYWTQPALFRLVVEALRRLRSVRGAPAERKSSLEAT